MSMSAQPFRHYLRRIDRHLQQGIILHYDLATQDLCEWYWPVNDADERVAPIDLGNFRLSHDFKAPCCLCAHGKGGYTEMAMFIAEDGMNFGKHMAGCASGYCGYRICLDNMYAMVKLSQRKCPLRSTGVPAPLPIFYQPCNVSDAASISRPMCKGNDLRRLVASMPVNSRSTRRPATLSENFFKLDSWGRAGLRESEFKKLFAKCICGLVMTTRVFQDHDCAIAVVPHTIIDLTTDNDNDSAVIDLTNDS